MKKVLIFTLFVFISLSFAGDQNTYATDGVRNFIVANVTSADFAVNPGQVRAVWSGTGGVIAIQQQGDNKKKAKNVWDLPAQTWVPLAGVTMIYRYYTGATATTSQVYDSTGVLVNGIILGW